MKIPSLPFKSLFLNVFLLIVLFLLIPVYASLLIIKNSYETYIQRELNSQVIASIQNGERELLDTFQRMVVLSNVFTFDRDLQILLQDENSSYWDRFKCFDELLNNLVINNLFSLEDIRITMFDNQRQNYANWGLYFNDYSFILEEEWLRPSLIYKSYITWDYFSPSFIIGENEQYISMARSILYPSYHGESVATIIISINEKLISSLLKRNEIGTDFILVRTIDTIENVFAVNEVNFLNNDELGFLLEEVVKTDDRSILCEVEGRPYLLSYYTLSSPWMTENQRLVVLYFTDYQDISDRLKALSISINFGMVLFLLILLVIVAVISHHIAKPIKILSGRVSSYTKTRKIAPFPITRKDEIGELGRAFINMEISINDLFDKLKLESEIREQYRFSALRAQINPHFLLNTLNTIRWMALIRKQDNIVDTINALSRILDYSMGRTGEMATLKEELKMIQSYVHIQNYRYGEDLEVNIDIEEGLEECGLIKFILQPMVENSFIHAFKKIKGKKCLIIAARQYEDKLKLFVQDNGSGLSSEKLKAINENLEKENKGESTSSIGLSNVHQRIRSGFGEAFGLNLKSSEGEGTTIEYILPLIEIPLVEVTVERREMHRGAV